MGLLPVATDSMLSGNTLLHKQYAGLIRPAHHHSSGFGRQATQRILLTQRQWPVRERLTWSAGGGTLSSTGEPTSAAPQFPVLRGRP